MSFTITLITKSSPEEYVSITGPGLLALLQILSDEQRIKQKPFIFSGVIKSYK